MSFVPRPQEIYKHFKGNLYQIVAVAEHSETGEQLVVYQAMYGEFKTYARPLLMFTERVDRQKYPDAAQEFRFELQGADAERQKRESAPQQDTGTLQAGSDESTDARQAGSAGNAETLQTGNDDKFREETLRTPLPEAEAERSLASSAEIDPLVMEFLDADTYAQKLNILAALHHRITDKMINTMAVACDVEVDEGDLESRYDSLRRCLLMREKYECNRLR